MTSVSSLHATIRDCSPLFETIRDYSRLFETIRDYSRLFETIRDYSRLFETFRDYSRVYLHYSYYLLFARYLLFWFSRHPKSANSVRRQTRRIKPQNRYRYSYRVHMLNRKIGSETKPKEDTSIAFRNSSGNWGEFHILTNR